MSACRVCGDTA